MIMSVGLPAAKHSVYVNCWCSLSDIFLTSPYVSDANLDKSSGLDHAAARSGLENTDHAARAEEMAAQRKKLFAHARRHSLLVRILRVFLPLAGLTALVGLFVITTLIPKLGMGIGIDLGDMKLSFNGSSIMMDNPKLSGFGDDGQAYEVRADSATQSILSPNKITLNGLFAKITLKDGTWAEVTSSSGMFDNETSALDLPDPISLNSSEGFTVLMQNAQVDLKAGTMTSRSPVEVRSDTGFLQANKLIVDEDGKRIRFTNGIRLTIVPPQNEGKLVVE